MWYPELGGGGQSEEHFFVGKKAFYKDVCHRSFDECMHLCCMGWEGV